MNKPNFLIVGGAKCGSTSLYHYLNQHPEVFMPVNKEPNYFVREYQLEMNSLCPSYNIDMQRMVFETVEYYNLFRDVKINQQAIGEASVTYLFKPEYAIPKIQKELENPKIIIILRNPIKRAFSHYSYACELGFEHLSFEDAISIEKSRLEDHWSSTFAYISQGMFYNQVEAYLNSFENVHILLLDDFLKDRQFEIKKIYKFLEVSDDFINTFGEEFNSSGIPRNKFVHKHLVHNTTLKKHIKRLLNRVLNDDVLRKINRKVRSINQRGKMVLSDSQTDLVRNIYSQEISRLSKLIGRDLTHWNK